MKAFSHLLAMLPAILSLGLSACGSNPTGPPSTELRPVIQRDGVAFKGESIPEEILDRLASYRVVVVGETHHLTEHREMMAALVRGMHDRGFRQLMMELPQMADWLLRDFVLDGGLEPSWVPPLELGGELITAVRDFNRTLPADERLLVRAIDVNLRDYGGAESFVSLMRELQEHLSDSGPIATFLSAPYRTPSDQAEAIGRLESELESRRSDLAAEWGESWFEAVEEIVGVERSSVTVRARRNSSYETSVKLREEVIKALADARLEEYPHGSIINIGGNHAQKEYLKGTDHEWLGDYLVHASEPAGHSVIVLVVTAARIVSVSGATTYYDLSESPSNELFRLMNETWPGHTVFLPLDDPVFSVEAVLVNFEGQVYSFALNRIYDIAVLLPLAHRDPGI